MDTAWQVRVTPEGLIGEILGYATGLILSVLFFRLIQRTSQNESGTGSRLAFSLCAILFNASGLIHKSQLLAGVSPSAASLHLTNFLMFALGAVWPAIGLHLWASARQQKRSQSFQLWISPISIGSAASLVAWLAVVLFHENSPLLFVTIQNVVMYYACFVLIAGLVYFYGEYSGARVPNWSLALCAVGILGSTLVTQLLRLPSWSDLSLSILAFLKQQLILLTIFGALFLFARLRFTDIFLKSALQILAIEITLFILWNTGQRLLSFPRTQAPSAIEMERIGVFFILTTVLLFGVLHTNRFLDWFIGHTLFREPDYHRSISTLRERLLSLEDDASIFQTTCTEAMQLLELEKVTVLAASPLAKHLVAIESLPGEAYEFRDDTEKDSLLPGCRIELLLPIRSGQELASLLAVAPGKNRRRLLGSEVSYLGRIAGLISNRMEALQVEDQRIELANREARMLQQLTEAELRALRAQINPHFLFNALNMLAELIRTAPEKAEEVTLRLSNVFRHVLRNSEKNVCQIQEEIDFLRAYLSIEEARLEENLCVDIQLDPQIAHEHIPSLLLQPIVENAIRHGLAPKLGPGRLEIVARGEVDAIILQVGDNGIGTPFPQDRIVPNPSSKNGGTGLGLKNTLERLRTFYKGQATLSFHSVPDGGSQVIIRIPRTVNL